MIQKQNLLNRLSNLFSKDSNSNLGQLLGAVGDQLDKVDPAQTNLEQQFAVSTATGDALDLHGKDWGVTRKNGESDDDYRKRIQAVVPIYTNGPTVSAIKQLVKNFTGVDPIILEYGPESFTMGVSPMGSFVFSNEDIFTFQIQVQNPEGIYYSQTDMENAVNFAKPARSTATFIHSNAVLNGRYALDGTIPLGG
jgi:hypothetical protein